MGLNRTPDTIVREAMAGDTRAFRVVVEDHQDFVYSVAYRFVHNVRDAEDLAQETFIRLWKSIGRYKPEVKLTTWLYKIVANVCLDHLKSRQHRRDKMEISLEVGEQKAMPSTADESLHMEELNHLLALAADVLTPKQKAVFVLRDLEGLDPAEVAEVLQMSPGNIKSNLFHARSKVGEIIKHYYHIKDEKHEM